MLQRTADVVAFSLIVVGVAIRMRAFLQASPLHIDENLLALELMTRPASALWKPLDLAQTAAPLFLVSVHGFCALFGFAEQALRAIPLIAGCLVLPAAWALSRRLLAAEEGMLVMALVALAPLPVYYSNFFKPYAVDMLITIVLVGLAIGVLRTPAPHRLALLAVSGVVATLASSSSVFTLIGVGFSLLLLARRERSARMLLAVCAMGIAWTGTMLVLMHTTYAELNDPTSPIALYMRDSWEAERFLFHSPAGLLASLHLAMASILDSALVSFPFQHTSGVLTTALAALLALGLIVLARRHGGATGALFLVPLMALLTASALRRYPLAIRVVRFISPLMAISVAAGAGVLLRRLTARVRVIVVAVLLMFPARAGLWLLQQPLAPRLNVPLQVHDVSRFLAPDSSAVYVMGGFIPAMIYYSGNRSRLDTAVVNHLIQLIGLEGPGSLFNRMIDLLGAPADVADSVLTVVWNSRRVLVGRATWIRVSVGHNAPYAGWSMREALRMRQAATCTDVRTNVTSERDSLTAAVTMLGGAIRDRYRVGPAMTYRICFSPPVPGSGSRRLPPAGQLSPRHVDFSPPDR